MSRQTRTTHFTIPFILILTTLLSILSLVGGGITIPPFKSTSWLKTSTSYVGLYGGCSSDGINPHFFSADNGSLSIYQARCKTLFNNTAPSENDPVGLLTRMDSLIVTGLQTASFLLIILLWTFSTCLFSKSISVFLSILAFTVQAAGFAYAAYKFDIIRRALLTGTYVVPVSTGSEIVTILGTETQVLDTTVTDSNTEFGVGLYLGGITAVGLLLVSVLGSLHWRGRTSGHEPVKTESRWDP